MRRSNLLHATYRSLAVERWVVSSFDDMLFLSMIYGGW